MATTGSPVRIHLFTYQMGFGDCFLLRFVYPDLKQRHVLIDFGSSGLPKGLPANHMLKVAQDIEAKCGGRLDAVVATHRHLDHISGFATAADGKGTGDIIRRLKPRVVVQPWTEQPNLPEDATGPLKGKAGSVKRLQALQGMSEFATTLMQNFDQLRKGLSKEMASRVRFLGETNVKNLAAVKNLATMGKNVYTYFGAKSGLDAILPGVKTSVLGPPTVEQSATVAKMRARDAAEYWHLRLGKLRQEINAGTAAETPFPGHPTYPGGKLPLSMRWIAKRVQQARADELLQIVTMLDDAMNNTSLILLFEVGGKKLLFPGDAQIENWQYALGQPEVLRALSDVTHYKVGHHGSLNATPKTLWNQFDLRTRKQSGKRLTTILSTMPGKHGSRAKGTEVPRQPLLAALQAESNLHDTQALPSSRLCDELVINLS
jgi:hypothetical protein